MSTLGLPAGSSVAIGTPYGAESHIRRRADLECVVRPSSPGWRPNEPAEISAVAEAITVAGGQPSTARLRLRTCDRRTATHIPTTWQKENPKQASPEGHSARQAVHFSYRLNAFGPVGHGHWKESPGSQSGRGRQRLSHLLVWRQVAHEQRVGETS